MYFLDENKRYNTNYGLSQLDRNIEALSAEYFKIDEFDFSSFLNFITKFASQLTYFNDRNFIDGDWSSFLINDPTLSILRLAHISFDELKPIDSNRKFDDSVFNELKKLIQKFIFIESNLIKLETHSQFKTEQEKLIELGLSDVKQLIYHILKANKRTSGIPNEFEFGSHWDKAHIILEGKQSKDHLKLLSSYFKKTINYLTLIKTSSSTYFSEEIINSKKVSPHIALLLTFHRLYQEASVSINNISKRHLSYYFNEVLKINLKQKKPDFVHLSFIANGENEVEVKKGEKLVAGKDDNGSEILYEIENSILFNKAKLSSIIGIDFYDDNELFLDNFEQDKTVINLSSVANSLGFVFGSRFLKLDEGVRKVSFEFSFFKDSLVSNNFIKKAAQILNNDFINNLFNVAYSTEDGWFELDIDKVDTVFHFNNKKQDEFKLEVIVLIENINPPLSSLKLEDQEFADNNEFPYFRFIIDNNKLEWYHLLKKLELSKVDVNIEVLEIKNLLLSNDFGTIEQGAPFEPFGSQPIVDSSFIIGHPNLFLYPIEDLKVNLEWYGLPTYEGGFSHHYRGYPWDVTNDIFEAKLSFLKNKRWVPAEEKQVVSLFQDVPDDTKAVSNIRRISEVNVRDLELNTVSETDFENTSYDINSVNGFLKMELCYPLQGFGHVEYPELLRESSIKAVSKKGDVDSPNEPYTPTLKSISIDISSKMSYTTENSDQFSFYHLHQSKAQKINSLESLFPIYNNGSALIIGIENYTQNKVYSILFQINEGFANKQSLDLDLEWSYFLESRWIKMNEDQFISDDTNQFKRSGIVKFDIAEARDDNSGLFNEGVIWIKVESKNNISFLNYLKDILLHCTIAKCHSYENVTYANIDSNQILDFLKSRQDVQSVIQKYAGYNGVKKEDYKTYFLRIAERLRHKNRVVSPQDYERILLENFSKINKVKCLSSIDSNLNISIGKVLIVVIPKSVLYDNLKGEPSFFSTIELDEMEQFLKNISPIGVSFKITNPIYEKVKLKFSLKLRNGFDPNFYHEKLIQDIKSFISPWMYNYTAQVDLGQSVSSALLLNFIEKLEYVDFVVNFSLFHIINGRIINQKAAKSNSIEIKPSSIISILIPDDTHIIIPFDQKDGGDNFGINDMMINTDYIVDYTNDEEVSSDNMGSIEKSYKIMSSKQKKNTLKSNFTLYITR